MAHTDVSDLVPCVFSTKERRKLVAAESQDALWSFIGGIARKNGFKALIVGGTEDHVHILLSLPATMPLAKAVQLLERLIFAVDERHPHQGIFVAGGVWRFHARSFAKDSYD